MAATLLLLLFTACAGARLGDLARRDTGDIFTLIGDECDASQCAEHGAGAGARGVAGCACACPQRAPLFREDRELCVDDLPECSLATFGTGTGVQRIPFVYLPLKGQIIHPSREITFQNVKTPICAVSGAQFLTRKGFLDLRNTLDADVPFKLFRDEGRTFIQWSGEDEVRTRMSGRVMVVRLLCRDVDATPTSPLDLRGVFTPCVAFRVQGTPPRHYSNVTEVQFAPNAQTSDTTNTSGLSITEYVAIGISALLLGLIYVASVFLFLHIRKRRKATSDEGSKRLQGIKKKDGSSITERDIVRVNNERIQTLPNSARQDDGAIKKNPLLNINRQYQESKSCLSDSGSNFSDSEDFTANSSRSDENIYNNHTIAAIVHQHHNEMSTKNDNMEICHRDESSIERLPHEHVSIVETTDDREITRPVGTTRRKLYFNPSYFEPKLMAEPPPAALEFLVKIREVIAIAKHKMATKRFQPVLNQIPEEETYSSNGNSLDFNQRLGSQRSESIVSLKRENSRRKNCVGCPGCQPEGTNDMTKLIKHNIPTCSNCQNNGKGDKQNIIRKWLENIPTTKQTYNECLPDANQNNMENSLLSLGVIDNENHKISNQNTFECSDSMYFTNDFSVSKGHATVSVRSDPLLQNYNLPSQEFENLDHRHNDYYQTIGKGLSHYRPDSFRNSDGDVNTLICNKNALPDMVNEAIALEHCYKSYNECSSVEEKFHNIILNTSNQNVLSVTRNITESPVGNDYETDSLERNSNKKGVSTLTEYPESPSSQASPSLSNALPLEEELTMRNAIYKTHSSSNSNTPSPHREICVDQNHYETIGKLKNQTEGVTASQTNEYSLVSEVYVNNNYNFGSTPTSPSSSECSLGSRKLNSNIKKSEEKPGCLTIEVKDSPENYIKIHESDDFEPDTLDRKQSKHKEIIDTTQFSRKDLIKNLDNNDSLPRQSIQLRSSGTFKKTNDRIEHSSKFHSLRNDYEQRKNSCDRPKLSSALFSGSKSLDEITDGTWDETSEWDTEDGRILTLELRHSKRQRQCTLPTINQLKNLARPDILPPLAPIDDGSIYEQPTFPPRRVEVDKTERGITSKNVIARSLNPRIFTHNTGSENIIGSSSVTTTESHCGPSCSSKRASVQSLSSEYDNMEIETISRKMDENCRNLYKRHFGNNYINTDTFVKGNRHESKPRFRRKKGSNVQDSGYLSSDSTNSQKIQRRIVVAKIVSCSESDDTENEARSESGAESIETHSVFFDHFRKPLITDEQYNNSTKNYRNFNRNHRRADDCNN